MTTTDRVLCDFLKDTNILSEAPGVESPSLWKHIDMMHPLGNQNIVNISFFAPVTYFSLTGRFFPSCGSVVLSSVDT
jgi:hypothetical protein